MKTRIARTVFTILVGLVLWSGAARLAAQEPTRKPATQPARPPAQEAPTQPAQPAGDAAKARVVLEESVKMYRSLDSYRDKLTGRLEIEMRDPDEDPPVGPEEFSVTLTFGRPKRLLLETEEQRLVSDGKKFWRIREDLEQYTEEPADELPELLATPEGLGGSGLTHPLALVLIDPQMSLTETLEAAFAGAEVEVVGVERVERHGRPCQVATLHIDLPIPGTEAPVPVRLYFDGATKLLHEVRVDVTGPMAMAAGEMRGRDADEDEDGDEETDGPDEPPVKKAEAVLLFEDIQTDASLSAERFTYQPGADFRKVSSFGGPSGDLAEEDEEGDEEEGMEDEQDEQKTDQGRQRAEDEDEGEGEDEDEDDEEDEEDGRARTAAKVLSDLAPERFVKSGSAALQAAGHQMLEFDVDGDGTRELIAPSWQGDVHVLSPDGQRVRKVRLAGISGAVSMNSFRPLKLAGETAWLATYASYSSSGTARAAAALFDAKGKRLWRYQLPRARRMNVNMSADAGDLTGDGVPEAVIGVTLMGMSGGRTQRGYVVVLNAQGEPQACKRIGQSVEIVRVTPPDAQGRGMILAFGGGRMQRLQYDPAATSQPTSKPADEEDEEDEELEVEDDEEE